MFPVFEHVDAGKDLYVRVVTPVCQKYGLTYMEYTVLMFLVNNPQYDTAAQIVKIRRLSKSHVSVSVRGLQEKGLVKGVYYPGNQKTLHLQLTEEAAPIVEEGIAAQMRFGAKLVEGFTPEEVAQLQYLTDKIHANMNQEDNS